MQMWQIMWQVSVAFFYRFRLGWLRLVETIPAAAAAEPTTSNAVCFHERFCANPGRVSSLVSDVMAVPVAAVICRFLHFEHCPAVSSSGPTITFQCWPYRVNHWKKVVSSRQHEFNQFGQFDSTVSDPLYQTGPAIKIMMSVCI